jgi:Protein of unknown function (DUF3617)
MPRWSILGAIAVTALPVFAAGIGLKAGLWEVRLVKQTVDGHDNSAQLAASLEHLKKEMASLPPEQRERMEAMMNQSGVQGSNGGVRVCVSPEMAQRNAPMVDREGHCQPASIQQHDGTTDFQFSCTTNGVSMSGKGQAVMLGNVIKTHTEVTTRTASGTSHETQNDTEMTYLGPDCGGVKPAPLPRP